MKDVKRVSCSSFVRTMVRVEECLVQRKRCGLSKARYCLYEVG